VREAAVYALGRIGPKAAAAVPKLTELIDDEEGGPSAVQALGEMGPAAKDGLPKLRKLLESSSAETRPDLERVIKLIEGKK
jgi:HEAT repeat protein